jgi:ribonuclease HI/ribosomal protein S18 acetylase RimI-like enzyme
VLATDGGSRGNPGPAAIGYELTAADGTVLAAHGEPIGVAGANVAEYRALIAGLEHAARLGLDRVDARCDARLVVDHVTGGREPANPRLRELCDRVRDAAERIGTVVVTWVPAESNGRAHALVAEALAAGAPVIEPLPPSDPLAEAALHAFMEEMSSRWLGRPATADDLREAFREFPSDELAAPGSLLLVAHRDGVASGCAGLLALGDGLGEVKRVWVSPASRRQGLGRRLMAEIERRARERGLRELRLDTRSDLVEARRMYERLGYREVEPFGDNPYAGHWFAKRL